MRSVFIVLAGSAGLAATFLGTQSNTTAVSIPILAGAVLIVPLSIGIARRIASRWEAREVQRLADYLRAAEAGKYHVTPIQSAAVADPTHESLASAPAKRPITAEAGFWEKYVRQDSWKGQ